MKRYKTILPIELEGFQFKKDLTIEERTELLEWGIPNMEIFSNAITSNDGRGAWIAHHGDWIMKGITGNFFVVKQDEFEKIYQPKEEVTKVK